MLIRKHLLGMAVVVGLGLAVQSADASLTIDVKAVAGTGYTVADFGKTVTLSGGAGIVVNFEVYAKVLGANSSFTDDGFQAAHGRLKSGAGGLLGDLTHALVAPFDGPTSSAGTVQDLDADTDKDVGALINKNGQTGQIMYRAAALQTNDSDATWLIGTGTFKVTTIDPVGTSFNFSIAAIDGLNQLPNWNEDGFAKSQATGTVLVGLPVAVEIPEPATLGVLALGGLALVRRRRHH